MFIYINYIEYYKSIPYKLYILMTLLKNFIFNKIFILLNQTFNNMNFKESSAVRILKFEAFHDYILWNLDTE